MHRIRLGYTTGTPLHLNDGQLSNMHVHERKTKHTSSPWEGSKAVHLFFRRARLTPGVYVPVPTSESAEQGVAVSSSRGPDDERFVHPQGSVTISVVEPDRVTGTISLEGAAMTLSGSFDVVRQKGRGAIRANVLEDE